MLSTFNCSFGEVSPRFSPYSHLCYKHKGIKNGAVVSPQACCVETAGILSSGLSVYSDTPSGPRG